MEFVITVSDCSAVDGIVLMIVYLGFSRVTVDTTHGRWCERGRRKKHAICTVCHALVLHVLSLSTIKITLWSCLSSANMAGKPAAIPFCYCFKFDYDYELSQCSQAGGWVAGRSSTL